MNDFTSADHKNLAYIGFSIQPRQVCCIGTIKPMIPTTVQVWTQAYPHVTTVKKSNGCVYDKDHYYDIH